VIYISTKPLIMFGYPHAFGVRCGVVVKALRYKPACLFPMVSMEFFSDIILPVALWP